jgi:DNA gyrase subunit A
VPEVGAPERLDLGRMLRHFLDFRFDVVTRRIRHDLGLLDKRIHVLEGFATIFDALDETIRIIRRSEGKKDAADKLMKRFSLDAEQVDAILELKLYRLAQLEILVIREELEAKQKEAKRLSQLLRSDDARWKLVRAELLELKDKYPDRRRTRIGGAGGEDLAYDAEAFIVDEDQVVILTQQGWVKRQREIKDVDATRVRDGDAVLEVVGGSTKACVAFFSSLGVCYVTRIVDVPQTTGYGEPVQKLFKMEDGERIVAMLSFDPRYLDVPAPTEGAAEPEPPYAVVVTRQGQCLRFSLRAHRDPSTRAGRKYCRLGDKDEVVLVARAEAGQWVAAATVGGHALCVDMDEINVLGGAGKGVMLVKLDPGDAVLGAQVLSDQREALVVEKDAGARFEITPRRYAGTRGGKGQELFKRGQLARVVLPEITVPGSVPAPEVS